MQAVEAVGVQVFYGDIQFGSHRIDVAFGVVISLYDDIVGFGS